MNVKDAIFRKEYKPNNIFYWIMLLCAVIILLSLWFIHPNSVGFVIISGVGSGGIASIIVAWLIDVAYCKKQNFRNAKIRFFYFSSLFFCLESLFEIPFWFSNKKDKQEKRWFEWVNAMVKRKIKLTEKDKEGIIKEIERTKKEIRRILDHRLEIMVEQILSEQELDNLFFISGELTTYELLLKTSGWHENLPYNTTNQIREFIENTRILSFLNYEVFSQIKHIDICSKIEKYFSISNTHDKKKHKNDRMDKQ